MKNKILGIIVCMLLIAATVLPVAGTMNNENIISIPEVEYDGCLDQTRGGSWIEDTKLLAPDGAERDFFGHSVSLDGDTVIIGAYGDDFGKGSAYVFKYDGTTWTLEAKPIALDGEDGDAFGISVSIDGDYALLGAIADDGFKGSAYVFKRSGTIWTQEDKLIASDGDINDIFGWSVSIDGDYAIIGAPWDDNDMGSAYVFKRSGTTWSEEQKLTALDGAEEDYFGVSVSIDGDYAIIGAFGDDDIGDESGSVYVFKRSGATWSEEQKLTASDGADYDEFGSSVSIDGDYAIMGSYGDDDNGDKSGSAYVFKRLGPTWIQEDKLLASDGAADDHFGRSVSVDGENAIVGAYRDDDNGDESGSAYVFKQSGTTWTEEDKLIASDGAVNDSFGRSVSIYGDYALVGAYHDDNDTGSAYVFKKGLECCLVIDNVSGGLLDSSGSLRVKAVIRNNGTGVCEDVNWSFNFSGGIVMMGQKNGLESTIPAGGTVTVYSKVVIGFSIPVLFPAFVTVTADAVNNNCPPATMEKHVFLLFLLLSVY